MSGIGLHAFVRDTRHDDLPADVRRMAGRCLIDLLGTALAGLATPLSAIIRDHAAHGFAAGPGAPAARMLFDGRRVSPPGAALAGGMTIDAFDAHDGHVLTLGHAGVAILPGLLALADSGDQPLAGDEFLAALVVGYEVAIRCGIAQHATCPDYHTSGAWNALGVAAVAARLRGFDERTLREALGIAEYHGPRSQMMRCIDAPTMVKDGSGWGAMCGLSAAALAAAGFTGAPALVVESEAVAHLWADLGARWRTLELYFKPYPICRWAQPAVEAVLALRARHAVDPAAIARVEIETFHNAARLARRRPSTTEEAQYSLPFPVAAAVVRGRLLPSDVAGAALTDPAVLAMSDRIAPIEDAGIEARFPAERLARARFVMADGRVLESDAHPARGDAERPLSDDEILAKFHALADPVLGRARADRLVGNVASLHRADSASGFLDLVLSGATADGAEATA